MIASGGEANKNPDPAKTETETDTTMKTKLVLKPEISGEHPAVNNLTALRDAIRNYNGTRSRAEIAQLIVIHGFKAYIGGNHVAVHSRGVQSDTLGARLALIVMEYDGERVEWNEEKFITIRESEHAALVAVAEAAAAALPMLSHSGHLAARKAAAGCTDGAFSEAYNAVLGQDRVALESALANLAAVREGGAK